MSREISIAFQTDKSAAQYIALAKLVDEYAFDAVSVYNDAPFQPGFAALLLMAPHIRRARLGVAAVSPSRVHPIDIAAQTALLAELAQSGVYIGLARGAWLEEHAIHEIKPAVQTIYEAVDVVRYLLAGRSDGYAGQIYQLAVGVRAPYPLPEQPIPILIGTWGEKLCAVAGEIADEVKIGGSANPDMITLIQNYIAVGERQAGRPVGNVGVVAGAVSVIDEDRGQARHAARRSVALYLPVVAPLDPTLQIEPELITRLRELANRHEYDAAGRLISDDLLDRFAFSGNPSDLIQQAERLFAVGTRRIEFGTPHGLSQPETGIHLLGKYVLPALKKL